MGPRKSASTTASAVSVFGALCLLTGSGVFLSAQIASPAAQPRCPAEPAQVKGACSLTLLPGEMKRLRFAVAQGNVEMLAAEQVEGAIELQLPRTAAGDASLQPPAIYTNQAGRHSSIRILLTPDRLTPDRQVTVGNASKDKPATVVLTLGAERSADANSALEQAAEEAFARAELLRVQDTQDKTAALKSYDQAIADWRKAANQPELARALIWKADFIVNNQGDAVLASPVIAQASGLLPLLEDIEAAHYWQVVAFVNVVQGNYTAVQDAYGAALALYEKAGDASHQAKVLDNAARVELMEGHADKALHEEQNAAELAGKAGDVRRQAFVQEELGAIYSTVGDSESAYRAYGQALAQMKLLPPEPRMQAALWVDFSDLYTTLGDFGRVKDALDQAMEIWKSTDYPIGFVDTLNNYGDLYIEKGQPSTAREYLSRGLDLSEKVHYERGSIALMSGIGESYLYERDTVRAEDFLNRALARAKKANQTDSETKIECHLGDLAMLKRDYKQAGEHYELCRKESVATEDTYSEIRSEGGLARSAFASGALDDAQSRCEQALGGIEATRGLLRNQDLRTSFFASQHAYYDLDIQILERLDQEHHNEGYGWQAFLIAERGRARTLLDQVATANADRPAASPALLAQYEDVQRRLRRLETGAARPRQAHGSQAANPTPAAMARLTLSEHQLHQEILGSGKTDEAAAASPALTLASLEHTLPDRRSALVEYWIGETASYAWIITRSGIRTFRLPSALQLDWKCSAFRKALLTTASPDPHLTAEQRAAMEPVYQGRQRKLGLKLSQTLLPPGILSPSTSTVFIVGDGPIESIPFAALPDSSSARTPRIRLRNVTFLNEPSAAIFSVLERNLPSQHPLRLAIFTMGQSSADVRNGDIRDALAEVSRNHPPEFSALPFAGDEAAMIRETMGTNAAHLFPADSLSPAALAKLDWNEFSIGHFAMHAVLNERYAELTGLALGRKQASAPAEMLWYGDISHLRTRLDLVVLSACNTAMGERIPGEGLRGLTQAFFASGSQRVLGTLWEVDDQATSEWMRHFYQALKATHSPALALHRTQETMAADPQWSSPYYWAGFVLAGDWRPLP